MKLMTKSIQSSIPKLGEQESLGEEAVIHVKFFDPCGSAIWYVTEYFPEEQIFHGYVTGLDFDQWENFSLIELEALKRLLRLGIERDLHLDERPISEILNKEAF